MLKRAIDENIFTIMFDFYLCVRLNVRARSLVLFHRSWYYFH